MPSCTEALPVVGQSLRWNDAARFGPMLSSLPLVELLVVCICVCHVCAARVAFERGVYVVAHRASLPLHTLWFS